MEVMIRRIIVGLGAAALLATAPAAFAQSAAEKAAVDAAKAAGTVGEQADGFLGFVGGSADSATTAAVNDINAGRAQAYKDIGAKTGVSDSAAGQATAQQLIARLPTGQYYRPLGGAWTRK
jgi:uncharacterized protein YdbL (DUF1318 family)